MQDKSADLNADAGHAKSPRSVYSRPTLMSLGSFASVTRMMVNGPYADGMLGLMPNQM